MHRCSFFVDSFLSFLKVSLSLDTVYSRTWWIFCLLIAKNPVVLSARVESHLFALVTQWSEHNLHPLFSGLGPCRLKCPRPPLTGHLVGRVAGLVLLMASHGESWELVPL